MYTHRLPLLSCALFASLFTQAQNIVPNWRPLTDSVFMVLHMDEDQIQRTRVIDAHYNEERHKLQVGADTLPVPDHERALHALIAAREKEVQGVMTHDQFQKWTGLKKRPDTKRVRGAGRR